MYVADMTLEDAKEFLAEAMDEKYQLVCKELPVPEQIEWDIEDLAERIEELEAGGSFDAAMDAYLEAKAKADAAYREHLRLDAEAAHLMRKAEAAAEADSRVAGY